MTQIHPCPKCNYEYTYEQNGLWVCSDCGNEWTLENLEGKSSPENENIIYDAHGNVLTSGDSVTVIKDLKVKGSSSVVKVGTKVKNIRLVESDDGHNIACKIEGIGAMNLKSEFVKKV